jgi:hypothetical protein
MRLLKIKIAFMLLLCFSQSLTVFAQNFPPPPIPPPPPGLPIDDYLPLMILLALAIGVFYFLKVKNSTKASDN